MSEAEARQHFIEHNLKVALILENVTVAEIAAIREFLDKYREEKRKK